MASIENYIESKYRELQDCINIEYVKLYQSFSSRKLQEIFSTIQHLFATNYTAMNTRLPTGDYEAHFWADNSRELLKAINVVRGLERVLKNTREAICLDSYYETIVKQSEGFLSQFQGSKIPPHMKKVDIYYTDPIIVKKDSIKLSVGQDEQRYVDLKQIGEGSYAKVFSYEDPLYNRKFAIKRANASLNAKELDRFKQEFAQMKDLHSPYIVDVYSYNSSQNEYTMEYVSKTLKDYLESVNPSFDERKRIVFQVLNAFRYIHSKGILHRDISPTNVLIKEYDDVVIVKVCDFGLVKIPDSTLTSLTTELKGSYNDPALFTEGFNHYRLIHETYALTRLVGFVMTGESTPNSIKDKKMKAFVERGMSAEKSERFKTVSEMIDAFRLL